jgi:uncharacterized protein with HEPN domain
MRRDDAVYLRHILDAIAKTEEYSRGMDRAAFEASTITQDAVIRQPEIIGEATKHLSQGLRSANALVPWEDISGMRDKLIHDYMGVDVQTVWLTMREDLPAFKIQVQVILETI